MKYNLLVVCVVSIIQQPRHFLSTREFFLCLFYNIRLHVPSESIVIRNWNFPEANICRDNNRIWMKWKSLTCNEFVFKRQSLASLWICSRSRVFVSWWLSIVCVLLVKSCSFFGWLNRNYLEGRPIIWEAIWW